MLFCKHNSALTLPSSTESGKAKFLHHFLIPNRRSAAVPRKEQAGRSGKRDYHPLPTEHQRGDTATVEQPADSDATCQADSERDDKEKHCRRIEGQQGHQRLAQNGENGRKQEDNQSVPAEKQHAPAHRPCR